MKELSIEQKAQAYDEALERAKKEYENHKAFKGFCEMLVRIFPSLKENNDEEIRKALINIFTTHKDYEVYFGVSVEDILAWVKRQGEQKPIEATWKPSEEQMKVLDEVLTFSATHENSYWKEYIFGTLCGLIRQLKNLKA